MKLGQLKIGKFPYVTKQVIGHRSFYSSLQTFRRQYETIVSVITPQNNLRLIGYWFELDKTRK